MASIQLLLEAPAVPQAAQRLAGLDVPRLLSEQLSVWAQEGVRTLQQATPVRTGRLQRSWQADVRPQEAVIENPTPYGAFLLTGTQPHRIQGSPFLAFLAGGKTVVTRAVEHPGTRSNAELGRAIESLVARGADVGVAVAEDVADQVTRGA